MTHRPLMQEERHGIDEDVLGEIEGNDRSKIKMQTREKNATEVIRSDLTWTAEEDEETKTS